MDQTNIKDFEVRVKLLINEEKWAEAFKICQEILRIDPENSRFIKYRNTIENEVKKINKRAIENELKKLEQLKIEHKYQEYLEALKPYQAYLNDFPEIAQIIIDASKLYEQDNLEKLDQSRKAQMQKIMHILDAGEYEVALASAEFLAGSDRRNVELRNFFDMVKSRIIEKKLHDNATLLNSEKYEDIIIFLTKLKRINASSAKVNALISKIKKLYQKYRLENRKDYIYTTIDEIKTLLLKHKYNKAMDLIEKIKSIDPSNKTILALYKKTNSKIISKMNKTISDQIFNSSPSIKGEYAADKASFIRI